MTTWTVENTYRCDVFDVERKQIIKHVESADDEIGLLTLFHDPIKVVGQDLGTYQVKCRSIAPVYGGSHMPQMLLCFGVEAQQ